MKNLVLISVLLMLFFQNCTNEELAFNTETEDNVLSENEKVLLAKMEETSKVLVQMVNNDDINKEIGELIAKKMYRDDYVFFKDLFEPTENATLKSAGIGNTIFEAEFDNILEKDHLKSSEVNGLKDYLIINNLALYVPYPIEDYDADHQTPTISFHPLLNDSINIGYEPIEDDIYKSANLIAYNEVSVDEEYTDSNPVYLIVPKEIEEPISTSPSEESTVVHEVRIGWVYLSKQYDGLFAGGSELRFVHGAVVANADGQVSGKTEFIPCDIPRSTIRYASNGWEKGYHQCNMAWDTNWKVEEAENALAVFEEDDKSEHTETSSMAFTDSITGITSNYSNSWKYYSQDAVIYNLSWDRDWFFITNINLQEWEFRGSYTKDGFPHRKLSETLKITTPYNELTY